MSTSSNLSPATWLVLGLSVAVGYTGLGLMGTFAPVSAATLLGIWPSSTVSKTAEDLVATSVVLLGSRDISIGLALSVFHCYHMPRSIGVLITSGLVLCYVDSLWIWKSRGTAWGAFFGIGATIWGWIGLNLLEL